MAGQRHHTAYGSVTTDPLLAALARLAAITLGFQDGLLIVDRRDPIATPSPLAGAPGEPDPYGLWTEFDAVVRRQDAALMIPDAADLTSDDGLPVRPGAYLGVPIRIGEDVVGVLRLTDPEPRSPTVRQLELLGEFGRIATLHLQAEQLAAGDDELDGSAAELARAIRDGEIVPWYQPIIDLRTDQIVGVEAFARWLHPDGEPKLPATFIAIAERSDLVIDLDLALIRQACADLELWQRRRPGFRLSVNLSGRHLDRAGRVEELLALTTAAGLEPGTIWLELTETVRPSDAELAGAVIERLRARGHIVLFDDFGAGYYDLQDLLRFSVDGLKIDRSFTRELDGHRGDALIRAITGAAHQLGMEVTIEGIETEQHAVLARRMGCDYAQGFYWSRAVPSPGVLRWLSEPATPALPSAP